MRELVVGLLPTTAVPLLAVGSLLTFAVGLSVVPFATLVGAVRFSAVISKTIRAGRFVSGSLRKVKLLYSLASSFLLKGILIRVLSPAGSTFITDATLLRVLALLAAPSFKGASTVMVINLSFTSTL